ncbi:MAG TPA: hypothetical protein VF458_16920 [Ktedonobacteraceae bacterium]
MEVHFTQIYTRPFFEIQLALARKVAEISREPLERVLMRYTAFYRIHAVLLTEAPIQAFYEFYGV